MVILAAHSFGHGLRRTRLPAQCQFDLSRSRPKVPGLVCSTVLRTRSVPMERREYCTQLSVVEYVGTAVAHGACLIQIGKRWTVRIRPFSERRKKKKITYDYLLLLKVLSSPWEISNGMGAFYCQHLPHPELNFVDRSPFLGPKRTPQSFHE